VNDRQRVEALFFPLLFKSVVTSSGEATEGNAQCVAYLDEAMREVMRDLDDRRKASIWRRVVRVHDAVMEPGRKGGLGVEKAGMIGFYLLNAVLASGYLELEEGSRVAVAVNAVVEALGDAFSQQALDASARKQAAKMLRQLQDGGFFEGVEMQREAA
jgi:hypothetical protein